jgi:hypothetical protein
MLSKDTIERWMSECANDPSLRRQIFKEEWRELCHLAMRGLSLPPEALAQDTARYQYLRKLMYVSGKGWLLGKAIPCVGEYDYNLAGAKACAAFDMAIDLQLPQGER